MTDGQDMKAPPRRRRRTESKKHGPGDSESGIRQQHIGHGKSGKGIRLRDTVPGDLEPSELDRSREKMREKARLYSAMKKGTYVPKDNEAEPLVDFDRKWSEADAKQSFDSDFSEPAPGEDGESDDDEIIEYEDEYGRTRRGTRAEKAKMESQRERAWAGAKELESMSARPAAPKTLIYGDAIQTMAFNPEDPEKMEELARKRDRSATPPEATHYNADSEIRDKGVGFYKFSKDEDSREAQMKSLEEQRRATESHRLTREEQKTARRQEIEARKMAIEARKARKMADSFLDILAADI